MVVTYEYWSGFDIWFLVFSRMAAILKHLEYNRFITIEAYEPSEAAHEKRTKTRCA